MAESLKVIALISGGKDSFYSLLHCLQNGHEVVALGNLYPAPVLPDSSSTNQARQEGEEEEHDLNSFMYQTVGHTVIPLYERALGIPLYRQEIIGTAVQTGRSYGLVPTTAATFSAENEDETESLVPLLKRIMVRHPDANALSTGAILSTYQRTRIESVALRLGLVPLSFLWQYPILPPGFQSSLLHDMQSVGLDARIIKVASGGLDESFLWQNVASEKVIKRVEKAMSRFGTDGDGAVIGEGGEFETLVVDGPRHLFKGRIEIEEGRLGIVREGGGSAWLTIKDAKVVMKDEEAEARECRVPSLLEPQFEEVLNELCNVDGTSLPERNSRDWVEKYTLGIYSPPCSSEQKDLGSLVFTASPDGRGVDIEETAHTAVDEIRQHLNQHALQTNEIIFTLIILRSMSDFTTVNKIYGSLFSHPNPPSRVTISCGAILPANSNLVIQIRTLKSTTREALHVQSRSYWAPANIGPYSQAISVPMAQIQDLFGTFIAGQIPLVPHTMTLPQSVPNGKFIEDFRMQAVLSLQHLWRIAKETQVAWFTSAVAYLPRCDGDVESKAIQWQAHIASQAWEQMHSRDESDEDIDDDVDLWEEKFYAGKATRGSSKAGRMLPDWDMITTNRSLASEPKSFGSESPNQNQTSTSLKTVPPFFAVEVEELPRSSMIEWHAHLGIVGGQVRLHYAEIANDEDGIGLCHIYQCVIGNSTIHTVVMIPWDERGATRLLSLKKAISVSTTHIGICHTSYVDYRAIEIETSGWCGTVIPCRNIFGMTRRLAAVMLFERSD